MAVVGHLRRQWLGPLFQSLDGVVDLVDTGQDFQHQRIFFGTGAKVLLQSRYEFMLIIKDCLFQFFSLAILSSAEG